MRASSNLYSLLAVVLIEGAEYVVAMRNSSTMSVLAAKAKVELVLTLHS
jgi:hypothetical protein